MKDAIGGSISVVTGNSTWKEFSGRSDGRSGYQVGDIARAGLSSLSRTLSSSSSEVPKDTDSPQAGPEASAARPARPSSAFADPNFFAKLRLLAVAAKTTNPGTMAAQQTSPLRNKPTRNFDYDAAAPNKLISDSTAGKEAASDISMPVGERGPAAVGSGSMASSRPAEIKAKKLSRPGGKKSDFVSEKKTSSARSSSGSQQDSTQRGSELRTPYIPFQSGTTLPILATGSPGMPGICDKPRTRPMAVSILQNQTITAIISPVLLIICVSIELDQEHVKLAVGAPLTMESKSSQLIPACQFPADLQRLPGLQFPPGIHCHRAQHPLRAKKTPISRIQLRLLLCHRSQQQPIQC